MPKPRPHFLWLIVTMLFVAAAQAPASEPTFIFETGDPPWQGERIELPPNFAPDLGWNGVEHIRFAPGMFEAAAPDFFSYVIAFLLTAEADVSLGMLEKELLVYYQGLSKAVMGSKGQSVDVEKFTISLEKAENLTGVPASSEEVVAYTGVLNWIEPFATQKDQALNLEIFVWHHGKEPVVLSSVSPVAFEQETPWTKLREISSKFRLEP